MVGRAEWCQRDTLGMRAAWEGDDSMSSATLHTSTERSHTTHTQEEFFSRPPTLAPPPHLVQRAVAD